MTLEVYVPLLVLKQRLWAALCARAFDLHCRRICHRTMAANALVSRRTLPELERLSRMYNSDLAAARACEIAPHVLIKAWRQAKIETPSERKKRRRREAKAGHTAMDRLRVAWRSWAVVAGAPC